MNNSVYQVNSLAWTITTCWYYEHAVIVNANKFIHIIHPELHRQFIEGMWRLAKQKLYYQSGTSCGLFASYLAEFQWQQAHKEHIFNNYLELLCSNYNI